MVNGRSAHYNNNFLFREQLIISIIMDRAGRLVVKDVLFYWLAIIRKLIRKCTLLLFNFTYFKNISFFLSVEDLGTLGEIFTLI